MRLSRTQTAAVAITTILFAYVGTCIFIKMRREAAFESVRIGDTADFVVARFGSPSVTEGPEELFSRYATSKCKLPCAQRLWFENRLALDTEAWSVSLGVDGRVVGKYHWVSP